MLNKVWTDSIKTWVQPEDVGALNQWLDSLQALAPVAGEHGLTKIEAFSLMIQVQSLNQLAKIKDLLEQIIANDIQKGDTPT